MRYLLDTNIVSELLRPAPNPSIVNRFKAHRSEVAIASTVWLELWFGCYLLPPSRRRQAIETYLRRDIAGSIPILPYDQNSAQWHAAERARLVKQGKTPSHTDGQIAAVAFTHGLILVTLNTRDFAAFEPLEVQTWQGDEPA